MPNPNPPAHDWPFAAIIAAASAVGIKLLDMIGSWFQGRKAAREKALKEQARDEVEERNDIRKVEGYLRDRLDALEDRHAKLLTEHAQEQGRNLILSAENDVLKIRVASLEAQLGDALNQIRTGRQERDELRAQMSELTRRVDLGGQA